MENLSNDHKDHSNQHENSHKLCDGMGQKQKENLKVITGSQIFHSIKNALKEDQQKKRV